MSYVAIDRHRRRIEAVLVRGKGLDPGEQLRSDLATLACVLASGYIEQTVKTLVQIHCANRGVPPTIERFVTAQLKRGFQSADVDRICGLLNALDPGFEAAFRSGLLPSQAAAINSVVSLRHQFAHGGTATTSLDQQEAYLNEIEAALLVLRGILA